VTNEEVRQRTQENWDKKKPKRFHVVAAATARHAPDTRSLVTPSVDTSNSNVIVGCSRSRSAS
jgi:hypothetical protein